MEKENPHFKQMPRGSKAERTTFTTSKARFLQQNNPLSTPNEGVLRNLNQRQNGVTSCHKEYRRGQKVPHPWPIPVPAGSNAAAVMNNFN
jgi:hypothetical protein